MVDGAAPVGAKLGDTLGDMLGDAIGVCVGDEVMAFTHMLHSSQTSPAANPAFGLIDGLVAKPATNI